MKIYYLLIASLFFLNNSVFAQWEDIKNEEVKYEGAMTFGLINSVNLTTISGNLPSITTTNKIITTKKRAPRLTMDVGITGNYYFNHKISLQMDLIYTYMGTHITANTNIYNEVGIIDKNNHYSFSMEYIKLPISINLYPKEKIYINLGGYIAANIDNSVYKLFNRGSYKADEIDAIGGIQPLDYGILLGIGFNTKIAKIGFQYTYGLSQFNTNQDYNLHNNLFQIVARWNFFSDLK